MAPLEGDNIIEVIELGELKLSTPNKLFRRLQHYLLEYQVVTIHIN